MAKKNEEQTNVEPAAEPPAAPTRRRRATPKEAAPPRLWLPLQVHYLDRLKQLAEQRRVYDANPERDKMLGRVIDRAIYATYNACVENGVGEDAKAILDTVPPRAKR